MLCYVNPIAFGSSKVLSIIALAPYQSCQPPVLAVVAVVVASTSRQGSRRQGSRRRGSRGQARQGLILANSDDYGINRAGSPAVR